MTLQKNLQSIRINLIQENKKSKTLVLLNNENNKVNEINDDIIYNSSHKNNFINNEIFLVIQTKKL